MPLFETLREFYYDYQLPLAHALHNIEQRGMAVHQERLASLRGHIYEQIKTNSEFLSLSVGAEVVAYKRDAQTKNAVCVNSSKGVAKCLKTWGIKVPINRSTRRETTDETALQRLYGETAHPGIKATLNIRELVKILGYVNAPLHEGTLYCSYVSIGTVTGRRSSRSNFCGLGTNHQNIPKHSDLGKLYRRCLIARPGKIFVACDQKGAEDWVVQGIIADVTGDTTGLDQLRNNINRHRKLAAFLFAKSEDDCTKDTMYYYLGKRTRHAGQYGMQAIKMSEIFAKEGHAVPPAVCQMLLDKLHQFEPNIRGGFQKYVESCLLSTRTLVTPIGRRRVFLDLRSHSDNSKTFREGYAQIPQSTVGDNTGLAIVWMEQNAEGLTVADGHDALYTEVDNDKQSVDNAACLLAQSFDRTLTFPNGTQINIPVEYELGYNLKDMITFEPGHTSEAIEKAKKGLD